MPVAFEPLWSLAVEEQFYLLWPFAVYFLSEKHLRRLCVALILLAPILRGALHFSTIWPIFMLTPFRMDLLACGGLLCLVWREKPDTLVRRGLGVAAGLFALGVVTLAVLSVLHITWTGNTRAGNVLIYESTLSLCLGFMVYALAGQGVQWLCWPPLRFIGKISYTMYLVHLGILDLLGHRFHGLTLASIALAITVAYATASWFLMERRLLHHKPATTAAAA